MCRGFLFYDKNLTFFRLKKVAKNAKTSERLINTTKLFYDLSCNIPKTVLSLLHQITIKT